MSLTDLGQSPTFRSTKGRVPVFNPMLNGAEFEVTVTDATVTLSEKKHDTAKLTCLSNVLTDTDGILDSPISFFYGQAPRTELFTGYVVDVGEAQTGEGSLTFGLEILGPTKVMQTVTPRFWYRKSAPDVARDLAHLNGLGYVGHSPSYIWHTLSQTDESDWMVTVNAANRLGWSVFHRYGVVMCYDPVRLFTESGAYARLISAQDHDFQAESDRRLIDFHPTEISSANPERMGGKVAYFTENGQVQVATQPGEFTKFRFYSSFVIRTATDAEVYLNALSTRMDSWKQLAVARIWGDADILPGMCIDIFTRNPRYTKKDQFNGRWIVRATKHVMDRSQYQTQLSLSRPLATQQTTSDPYQSFWHQAGKPKPSLLLQEGAWVSSWTNPTAASTAP